VWKRVLFALIALVIYANAMPVAGYLITTFLLMSFLFWIVRGRSGGGFWFLLF